MTDQELNDIMAEKVMGFQLSKDDYGNKIWLTGLEFDYGDGILKPHYIYYIEWQPVEESYYWIMVVDNLIKKGYLPGLKYKEDGRWVCILWPGEKFDDDTLAVSGHDSSIGKAVCLAASKTMEEK